MPDSLSLNLDLPPAKLVEANDAPKIDSLLLQQGATIRVSYEGMSPQHQIRLLWETKDGQYAPIAPQFGVEEGSVDFHVSPYDVGLRIDNYALFAYVVTCDDQEQESHRGNVRINLPSNLVGPTVLQAPQDNLDLSRLCCEDPQVHVPAWAFIQPGQIVWLYVYGEDSNGNRVRVFTVRGERVTAQEALNGWSRTLSRAELATLKHESRMVFAFSVGFAESEDEGLSRLFPGLVLTLLTQIQLDLVAPTVVEATQVNPECYALNPGNAKDGATMRISYENMCSCDWVCASWDGGSGAGTPVLECKLAGSGDAVDFHVPPSAISSNFCKEVQVSHTVLRDGQLWSSPSRSVRILNISGLPSPEVTQATDKVLDLNTFKGDAEATMIPYDFGAEGQPCWLWVTGKREDGSDHRIEVLVGEPLTEQWLKEGVSTLLPRQKLEKTGGLQQVRGAFRGELQRSIRSAQRRKIPGVDAASSSSSEI